ncbi:PucR family transcriptional regulator [Actinomadura sp. LD22]|uniref:PucR family transcriptional regulator n=1 Tax=Actinomadura physcomitrii TaxID=2650748 RepID=A0A6I4M9Z5_9ACTN|nr:PucR family transcriptional regulator [Actinomadura physcomitrii]MWA02370.1 PucR family transcriptional regulator [Actinomadura physcomitrii]MWA03058.1 PucR family transcriptional regulator [Actinomadura physcomitrii]
MALGRVAVTAARHQGVGDLTAKGQNVSHVTRHQDASGEAETASPAGADGGGRMGSRSASRVIEIEISGPRLLETATRLRKHVPEAAREAIREIERELPEFVRPDDPRYAEVLTQTVEWIIGHFVELMADPETPSTELLDFLYELGVGEAREGRGLEQFQTALRIGAGVALNRLNAEAEAMDIFTSPSTMAQITQALFAYHDRLTETVAEGHAAYEARSHDKRRHHLGHLVELLVTPAPAARAIGTLAGKAGWRLPDTVAAVAVNDPQSWGTAGPALPDEVLNGLDLAEPCLIVPDPEGPGRRTMLRTGLRGRAAAVGPTVAITEVARSLRWARQGLALAERRIISTARPFFVTDHLPIMMIMQDEDLTDIAVAVRLAPLASLPVTSRMRLATTFFACLECNFNAAEVGKRLRVHPQTVRYRIRQLEQIFGPDIHDLDQRFDYLVTLRAWLAMHGP